MRPDDHNLGLLFLLSLGAVPLGCTISTSPGTPGDTTSGGANTDPGGSTNPGVDPSGDTPGVSGAAGTTSGADGTTSGADGTADGSTGPGTGEPGTAGSTTGEFSVCGDIRIPEVCRSYAARIAECDPRYAEYQSLGEQYCACYLADYARFYGEACATALEEHFACLAASDCEAWKNDTTCAEETAALKTACEFEGETTGGDASGAEPTGAEPTGGDATAGETTDGIDTVTAG